MAVTIGQAGFRLRNDDGNETTATWKAAQNVNTAIPLDTNFRVRFLMQNSGTTVLNNLVAQLEYTLNGGASTNVTGASTVVRASASPNVADQANLTQQLTGGTGTFQGATAFDEADGACGGNSLDIAASGNFEVEFSIQIRSADVVNGDVIGLRVTNNGTDFTGTYSQVPSITVATSVSKTPIVGALTLAGVEVQMPVVKTPAAGILRFGLQSYSIKPDVGEIDITGNTPGSPSASVTITPNTGSLTLASDAPTVTSTANVALTPLVGALSFVPIAGSTRTDFIRGPPVAALALTGIAPTLRISLSATPSAGTLTAAGNQPTVQSGANVAITPTVGSLTLSGIAPTVSATNNQSRTPTVGALTLTGNAPTVTTSAGTIITPSAGILRFGLQSYSIKPDTGALALTGQAAQIAAGASPSITPTLGSLTLTGNAPPIGKSITPLAGALTFGTFFQEVTPDTIGLLLIGNAPTLQVSAGATITPATGSLALSGVAPTLKTDTRITPAAGALTLSGLQPIVQSGAGVNQQPGTGALTLTGAQPTISQTANVIITPSAGSLIIAGAAPTVQATANVIRTPVVGSLAIAGLQPTVQTGNNRVVIPTTGAITVSGNQPTISRTANVVLTPSTGALVIVGQSGSGAPGGGGGQIHRKRKWRRS